MKLKICFVAPSSYGKSTASNIIIKEFGGLVIKIAEPLYELQNNFYKKLGIIADKQDGELLQFYGKKIRQINPEYLLNVFNENIRDANDHTDIIINDDCRPMDYEYLKNLGFIFIKINGYKREREDYKKADDKNPLEWQNNIPCDYEINNYGNLEELKDEIIKMMGEIKNDRKMLYHTSRKIMQC